MSRERIHASELQYHEELTEQEESLTQQDTTVVRDVSEVDDILDQIVGLLAVNAEEFVTGFVQKGGQ